MPTPRLWSWKLSPFAGKARIALAVSQIEVELVEVDPANRPDELSVNFFQSFRKAAFGPDKSDPEDIVEILRGRLQRRWPVLDGLLARTEGPWLTEGAEPTLADLAAMPLAVRLPQWAGELDLGPEPGAQPLAAAWLEALRGHPQAPEVKRAGS